MKPVNDFQEFKEIEEKLSALNEVKTFRNPERASNFRSSFIREVTSSTVTKTGANRLTLQDQIQQFFDSGKGRIKMSPVLVSLLAVFVLLFGGGGAGVVAAQSSLPGEMLYPVKLASEDVRLALTTSTIDKLNLELALGETRLDEIIQQLQNDDIPDDEVFNRLDGHLLTAYQLALETGENNTGELTRLRERIQTQAHLMEQIHISENPRAEEVLIRTRNVLQSQVNLVDQTISPGNTSGVKQNDPALGNGQGSMEQNQTQSTEQNQTQSMEQNQTQSMEQNQTQSMEQNQTQSMEQNQTQSMEQNQTQSMEQNQTQSLQQNQIYPTVTPTPIPKMSGNQGSMGGNGNNSGNGKR